MKKQKLLNTKQIAEIEGISERAVRKKIQKYRGAQRCACEHHAWLVPAKNIALSTKK